MKLIHFALLLLVAFIGCEHRTKSSSSSSDERATLDELPAAASSAVSETSSGTDAISKPVISANKEDARYECPECGARSSFEVGNSFRQCFECWVIFDTSKLTPFAAD
jgi:hypothetical protein